MLHRDGGSHTGISQYPGGFFPFFFFSMLMSHPPSPPDDSMQENLPGSPWLELDQ